MFSVADAGFVPGTRSGLLEPKLRVGSEDAPEGLEEMEALSVTVPVNPPEGVMAIVEVFPLVEPRVTVTAVPCSVRPGAGTGPLLTDPVYAPTMLSGTMSFVSVRVLARLLIPLPWVGGCRIPADHTVAHCSGQVERKEATASSSRSVAEKVAVIDAERSAVVVDSSTIVEGS